MSSPVVFSVYLKYNVLFLVLYLPIKTREDGPLPNGGLLIVIFSANVVALSMKTRECRLPIEQGALSTLCHTEILRASWEVFGVCLPDQNTGR